MHACKQVSSKGFKLEKAIRQSEIESSYWMLVQAKLFINVDATWAPPSLLKRFSYTI